MGISLHKCQMWKEGQDRAYDRRCWKTVETMRRGFPWRTVVNVTSFDGHSCPGGHTDRLVIKVATSERSLPFLKTWIEYLCR